ncbi:hypothetical protein HK104_011253 [Borealophlyctis nickersoniae]|nr:hypothetical protein HK104_011253 [Borealophlyctis nickersoniae]
MAPAAMATTPSTPPTVAPTMTGTLLLEDEEEDSAALEGMACGGPVEFPAPGATGGAGEEVASGVHI